MHLLVTFQDRSLGAFASRLRALSEEGRGTMAVALNEAVGALRKKTVAAETRQTGLAQDVLERAQHLREASEGSLTAQIVSQGGNVRLKFFGAKETPQGVMAHPFNREQVFHHAFMSGGRFPNRVAIARLNGQVIERKGSARRPTRTVRSGVVIPTEMTTGATAQTFERGVSVVATTIVTRLGAILG